MSQYRVKTRRRCPHISLYSVLAKVRSFILCITSQISNLYNLLLDIYFPFQYFRSIRSDPESVVWCQSSEESYNPINPGIVSSLDITEPLSMVHTLTHSSLSRLLLCNYQAHEWSPVTTFNIQWVRTRDALTRLQFVHWRSCKLSGFTVSSWAAPISPSICWSAVSRRRDRPARQHFIHL